MATFTEASGPESHKGWIAYIFSPQVLLGGVLAWGASTGWDYFKENRSETAKVLAEVRGTMAPHIIPTPTTIETTSKSIDALKRISEVHENQKAKDLVNTQIAYLYWVRDDLKRAEAQDREASQKKKIADEEARKTEEARKALADAATREQAARAEALRLQEVSAAAAKRSAEVAAQQATAERIQARLAQRALDRAPK